jgi:hypothetical protein
MQFLVLLMVLAFFQAAVAQTWQQGSLNKYTTLVGVHAANANEAYGAVMDNSVGYGVVHTTDYATTGTFYGPAGAMNMDVAYTADGSTGALVGFGGIFIGPASSASFTKVAGIHGITQNVEAFGASGFGVTGQFSFGINDAVNGVCVSFDAGKTWTHADIRVDASHYGARYGAFPSESTWFVSSGMWPSDESRAAPSLRDPTRLSKYISAVPASKSASASFATDRLALKGTKPTLRGQRSGDDNTTGWYGGISRTTDGGKTWTQVFTTDLFYFNQIHCADVNTCMAVGENDDGAFAVSTTDGGATWNQVLTAASGTSLVAVRMISATEAWVSGGAQSRAGGLQGYYYHTTDGGASWVLSTATGYSFDLSFSHGVGYSAFLTQSYSSMAVYK